MRLELVFENSKTSIYLDGATVFDLPLTSAELDLVQQLVERATKHLRHEAISELSRIEHVRAAAGRRWGTVVEICEDHGGITSAHLAASIPGWTKSKASHFLHINAERGKLRFLGNGWFELVEVSR